MTSREDRILADIEKLIEEKNYWREAALKLRDRVWNQEDELNIDDEWADLVEEIDEYCKIKPEKTVKQNPTKRMCNRCRKLTLSYSVQTEGAVCLNCLMPHAALRTG